jgi:triacylglycerol lipase
MRRRLALLLAVLAVALVLPAGAAGAQTARTPILFVHGWSGSSSTWDTMIGRFKAAGYTDAELFNWTYDWRQSNATTAAQVAAKVDEIRAQTGWARIDVITHSMGGLPSRYYLRNLGGHAAVDEWVSLGGPNHGTEVAHLCFDVSCFEMRTGSAFLNDLNAGDETPFSDQVRYGTWWSPCDEAINPDQSTVLDGATNTQTPCMTHGWLHQSPSVFGQVAAFVAG